MQTILWLHAFPLSSRMFERQRGVGGVTHLMPDLPGFGSAAPLDGEADMDAYARFAIAQLDARGIGKAIFAGVSMGGYIAFSALRLFPERIAGLILIDTRETADTPDGRQGRFDAIARIEAEGVQPLVDSMFPKMLTPEAPADMKKRVHEIMMSTPPRAAIDALKAIANRRDATPLLPTIDLPAMVIVGEEDTITPPSDAERMAHAIPGATLVKIANAAHLSNVEQAAEFNAAVAAFLE